MFILPAAWMPLASATRHSTAMPLWPLPATCCIYKPIKSNTATYVYTSAKYHTNQPAHTLTLDHSVGISNRFTPMLQQQLSNS